jgi:uncharacterized LabA/DUF88 family protein
MAFNTAILYDIENIGGASLQTIRRALLQTGRIDQIAVQRAYARWELRPDKTIQEVFELGIDPIEVRSYKKNAADVQLATDAMELVNCMPSIRVYVLVSGDGGFVRLVQVLHECHKMVVGCGIEESTRPSLKDACDAFVPIPKRGEGNGKSEPKEPLALSPIGETEQKPAGNAQISDILKTLRVLTGNAKYSQKLKEEGQSLSLVAEFLRSQIKNLDTSKNRWFLKLLLPACEGTDFCVAKSKSSGNCRLFARDSVHRDYEIIDA